jgi:hypothetical protein
MAHKLKNIRLPIRQILMDRYFTATEWEVWAAIANSTIVILSRKSLFYHLIRDLSNEQAGETD